MSKNFLVQGGHQIASHGYGHELVSNQTPDEFREDVRRSKAILENLIGSQSCGPNTNCFHISTPSGVLLE
jgi:peptidoglycan/xylan/chitin deacetylase (PgdA/CDA1 family)